MNRKIRAPRDRLLYFCTCSTCQTILDYGKNHDEKALSKAQRWAFITIMTIGLSLLLFVRCAHAEIQVNTVIIAQIESSGNPKAFNKRSGARGLCQITPIVLKEFNQLNGTRHFELNDLYDPNINIWIGNWYLNERIPQLLKHYHLVDTVKNRLWAYNAGIRNVVRHRMPLETRNYIKKYNKMMGD